jgi:hypothetical protein
MHATRTTILKKLYLQKELKKKLNPHQNPKTRLLKTYKDSTENVIVLVIDGPRYSDTWGAIGTPLNP